MMKKMIRGFTLIEMLLVMVIISIIVYAGVNYVQRRTEQMRIDKASMQMQQILNAGMAYYVVKGHWPAKISDLFGSYLPSVPNDEMLNPWGDDYKLIESPSHTLLYVWGQVNSVRAGVATLQAKQVAGSLPLAYTSHSKGGTPPPNPADIPSSACKSTDTTCFVVAAVNIPGQNLNNANAVTFAGLYKHGGCVPVPTCPVDSDGKTLMKPQIFVVPVSVSGTNDIPGGGGGGGGLGAAKVYPISSFTAYAMPQNTTPTTKSPPKCIGSTASNWISGDSSTQCQSIDGTDAAAYWRVCLQVITERGNVQDTGGTGIYSWGQYVTLLAITRCSVPGEASGSKFTVYSN